MWPYQVIMNAPFLDQDLCLPQVVRYFTIEQLYAFQAKSGTGVKATQAFS